jgi:hypothetical protein
MPAAARVLSVAISFFVIHFCFLSLPTCAQHAWEQSARARGGLSYFQDSADSQLGALYGLDLSAPMFEQANLFGSFTHNHFEEGS